MVGPWAAAMTHPRIDTNRKTPIEKRRCMMTYSFAFLNTTDRVWLCRADRSRCVAGPATVDRPLLQDFIAAIAQSAGEREVYVRSIRFKHYGDWRSRGRGTSCTLNALIKLIDV